MHRELFVSRIVGRDNLGREVTSGFKRPGSDPTVGSGCPSTKFLLSLTTNDVKLLSESQSYTCHLETEITRRKRIARFPPQYWHFSFRGSYARTNVLHTVTPQPLGSKVTPPWTIDGWRDSDFASVPS